MIFADLMLCVGGACDWQMEQKGISFGYSARNVSDGLATAALMA
jgi:hypothetical protein